MMGIKFIIEDIEMFERLSNILKKTKTIPNSIKEQKELKIELVSRYSNGNVSLQRGNFITKNKLMQKEKEIFAHRFI